MRCHQDIEIRWILHKINDYFRAWQVTCIRSRTLYIAICWSKKKKGVSRTLCKCVYASKLLSIRARARGHSNESTESLTLVDHQEGYKLYKLWNLAKKKSCLVYVYQLFCSYAWLMLWISLARDHAFLMNAHNKTLSGSNRRRKKNIDSY